MGYNFKYIGVVIFSSILSVGNVAAEGKWHSSKIKRVYPTADGGFVFTFLNNSPDCPSTGSEKYHYVLDGRNGMTKEGVNKIYSLVLAAAVQGKTVHAYFDDGTADCFVNRLYVSYQ